MKDFRSPGILLYLNIEIKNLKWVKLKNHWRAWEFQKKKFLEKEFLFEVKCVQKTGKAE